MRFFPTCFLKIQIQEWPEKLEKLLIVKSVTNNALKRQLNTRQNLHLKRQITVQTN